MGQEITGSRFEQAEFERFGARLAHELALLGRLFTREGFRDGDRDGELIRSSRPVMPSMLMRDARVVRQDCLCYFMERFPLPE